jgi:hypothetical protein
MGEWQAEGGVEDKGKNNGEEVARGEILHRMLRPPAFNYLPVNPASPHKSLLAPFHASTHISLRPYLSTLAFTSFIS